MQELGKMIELIKLAHEFVVAWEKQVPQIMEALKGIDEPARAFVAMLDSVKVTPTPVELPQVPKV